MLEVAPDDAALGARKMRELVPPPWRHRIRGRRRVGSAGTPSAGVIECGIESIFEFRDSMGVWIWWWWWAQKTERD